MPEGAGNGGAVFAGTSIAGAQVLFGTNFPTRTARAWSRFRGGGRLLKVLRTGRACRRLTTADLLERLWGLAATGPSLGGSGIGQEVRPGRRDAAEIFRGTRSVG